MHGRKAVILVGPDDRARALFGQGVASGLVELREAPSIEEAIRLADVRSPDLFVTAFPDAETSTDGLRLLRGAHPAAKVVVLCGDSPVASVLGALREHAFAFLRAPWTVSDAREAISRALSLSDWEDGIEVQSARPEWVSLRLRCRRLTADRVLQFLTQLRIDLSAEERESLAAAVREILLNAIEHGGAMNPDQWVRISRIRTARLVVYHVEDPGPGFSFDNLGHSAVSNPPGQPMAHAERRAELGMRPGGFGILLTRGLVDDVIYSEKGNEVILVRHVEPAGI